DVVALPADGDDLHRLALCEKAADTVARKTRDLRVEAAAQPALGSAHDEQMNVLLAAARHQCRCVATPADRLGDVGEHGRHALRIGARRLRRLLRAPQLCRGDHLHRLGDLLRRLHRGDAVAHVFERGHLVSVRLSAYPRSYAQAKVLAKPSTSALSLPRMSSVSCFSCRIASSTGLPAARMWLSNPCSKRPTCWTVSLSR